MVSKTIRHGRHIESQKPSGMGGIQSLKDHQACWGIAIRVSKTTRHGNGIGL